VAALFSLLRLAEWRSDRAFATALRQSNPAMLGRLEGIAKVPVWRAAPLPHERDGSVHRFRGRKDRDATFRSLHIAGGARSLSRTANR